MPGLQDIIGSEGYRCLQPTLWRHLSQQDAMQTLHSDMPWCFQPPDTACESSISHRLDTTATRATCTQISDMRPEIKPKQKTFSAIRWKKSIFIFTWLWFSLILYCHQYRSVKPWCPFLHPSGSARIMRCPIINRLPIMRKSHTHRRREFMAHRQTYKVWNTHQSVEGNCPYSVCMFTVCLPLSGTAGVGHSGAWGMREITQLRYVQMAPLKHWLLSPTQGREWEIESVRGEKRKWQGKEWRTRQIERTAKSHWFRPKCNIDFKIKNTGFMYDWHICIALSLLIYVIQVNEHFTSNSNILILNLGLNIYLSVP